MSCVWPAEHDYAEALASEEHATAAPPPPLQRSRGGAVLIGALVVDSIGNGLFLPLGLIYFTRITDVPLVLIGVLLSVATVVQLPIPVFAGVLADRYGARPLVVVAQFLQAVGYAVAGVVSGPAGILGAAVLIGLGVRLFWSSVFTMIADYIDGQPAEQRHTKDYWYGWSNMARTAGLGVGGFLTGIALANPDVGNNVLRLIVFGTAACFAVAGLTIALAVRAPHARRHEEAASQEGYRDLLRDRPYLGLVVVNTVFALSTLMLTLALPVVILIHLDAGGWLVSGLLVGNTIVVSVITAPVVLWLRPFRRTRVLAAAGVLWVVWALLMAVLSPGQHAWVVPVLIVATVLFTAATVMHAPISMGLAAAAAPAPVRGRYLAVFQYSFTLAEFVGPSFFTTLFAVGAGLPWVVLAVCNGVAVVAVLMLERRLPTAAVQAS